MINPVFAEYLDENLSVNIKPPYYPIENLDTQIEFYIWNGGNSTFNGTLTYWVDGEKIRWKETEINITTYPKNYTSVIIPIKPTYPGPYWANVQLKDKNRVLVYTGQSPFNVHSFGETATIAGVIIPLLSLVLFKYKK